MTNNNKGFTLIELLVSIGIAGVLLAAVFTTFMLQNTSYKRQEQIVELQQNLRSALNFMTREIRMAKSDPLSQNVASIVSADAGTLHFTLDVSGGDTDDIDNDDDGQINEADEAQYPDGDVDDADEDITYALYDAYGDGDNDIGRDTNTGGGNQPVAENVDVLDFVYLDSDGNVVASPVSVANLPTIWAVQLTIVARTNRQDPNFTDNAVYTNLQGTVVLDKSAAPDNFRRRMVRSTIKMRN